MIRKRFNLKDFQINQVSYKSKSNNNPWLSLSALILIIYLGNYLNYKLSGWQLPTVEANETDTIQLYSKEPSIQDCDEGILKPAEAEKVLQRLNYIRSLHGLNPVTYNYRDDTYTAKAALVTAANVDKDQLPDASFRCWSEPGKIGRENSLAYSIIYTTSGSTQALPSMNLYKSENFIDAMLMDSRRESVLGSSWLLNPFLKSISFGRVDDVALTATAQVIGRNAETVERQVDYVSGATIKFTDATSRDISNLNADSIAFPIGEYPQNLFKADAYQHGYPPMLFSIAAAEQKLVNQQNVDFAKATVEISGGGTKLVIDSVTDQKDLQSLPNALTWKAKGIEPGTKYTVTIKNVKVFDKINSYEYWFKLK